MGSFCDILWSGGKEHHISITIIFYWLTTAALYVQALDTSSSFDYSITCFWEELKIPGTVDTGIKMI